MATVNEEEFHPAVQLLLARMKTDPEEFIGKGFRWQKTLTEVQAMCTDEEKVVLQEKYRLIQMDALHVQAMKIMTRTEEPDDDPTRAEVALSVQQMMQQKHDYMRQQQMAAQDLKAAQVMQQMGLNNSLYGDYDKYIGNQSNSLNQQAGVVVPVPGSCRATKR